LDKYECAFGAHVLGFGGDHSAHRDDYITKCGTISSVEDVLAPLGKQHGDG